MATLANNPHAVSTMVERLGRMNIATQDLQTADEFPVAQTMIDNIPSDIQYFFGKHDSPDVQCLNGSQYEPMLDPFEYRLPLEFEIESFLSFPDILSTVHPLHLSTHRIDDDLSIRLDEMEIDSDTSGSFLLSLPETTPAIFFENPDSASSTYTSLSASPPLPSFYELLEEVGIDIEHYEELSKRYSPDVQWEDIPLSVREYQMQELYLEQAGDLCNEMEGITMSQNPSGGVSPTAPVEFDMTVAQDRSNALGLVNGVTEGLSPMPLGDSISINSFTNGNREEVESALWAPT